MRLVVLTRHSAYGAQLPAFVYDELATVGHPVAQRLRQSQMNSLNILWRKACLPPGHKDRGSLPERCNRKWFEQAFCGGADLSAVAAAAAGNREDEGAVWPHVTGLNMYDPLALLAAHPTTLERFFEVEIKFVRGVEHMVIGTSEERPGIRNGTALRSFLMDAFRYALSESLEHAWQTSRTPHDDNDKQPRHHPSRAMITRRNSVGGRGMGIVQAGQSFSSSSFGGGGGGGGASGGASGPSVGGKSPTNSFHRRDESPSDAGPRFLINRRTTA